MGSYSDTTIEAWTKPGREMFEYWISFFPTAPLFGVEWRFGDLVNFEMTMLTGGDAYEETAAQADADADADDVVSVDYEEVLQDAPVPNVFAAPPATVDDLTVIKGIGPGVAKQLNAMGVYQLAQLAAFTEEQMQWVDDQLSSFKGRCFRDDWSGQARMLIA